jgi:hypothetical protein
VTIKKFVFSLAVGGMAIGCTGIVPPPMPPVPSNTYVHVPFDTAWQRAIGFFADSRIPIQTIEKASGLIVSTKMRLSSSQVQRWADCGHHGQTPALEFYRRSHFEPRPMLADFNIFVQPAGDSTAVRVNLGLDIDMSPSTTGVALVCVTNGQFEKSLIDQMTPKK